MSKIVLTTINATYSQTSLGLRYLLANMGDLEKETVLQEYTLATRVQEIAEKILNFNPMIVGISLYIWNYSESVTLVRLLKKIRPEILIVGGGPEFRDEFRSIEKDFDYIICGEADIEFGRVCAAIINNEKLPDKIITAKEIDVSQIKMPYRYYSNDDIKTRRVMVESSRGCPFSCHFCISSLDRKVRRFETKTFLAEIKLLWDRGAREFKFIDRTFNLKMDEVEKILNFFLPYSNQGLFLHFEIVPDHIDDRLFVIIEKFPPGVVQFEVGLQTFNAEVSERIGRKQDYKKVISNIKRLVAMKNVHLHTDLIVGLPGEDLDSFQKGFDRLIRLRPHEIQVGILKRLKGAPIKVHSDEFNMIYRTEEPYEVISTAVMSFDEIQKMRRFSRYWNLYYNSGNFKKAMDLFLGDENQFERFYKFSNWIYLQTNQTHQFSLERLARLFVEYIPQLKDEISGDYMSVAGRTLPPFLRNDHRLASSRKRQQRHSS